MFCRFIFFSGVTRHFKCLTFFIIHNERLAVIALFIDRQILIRHIPQHNFIPSMEMISTFWKKKSITALLQKWKKVPKNNKTICTLLLWHWIKGKLLSFCVQSRKTARHTNTADKVTAILDGGTHSEFKSFGENNTDDFLWNKTSPYRFSYHERELHVLWTTTGH